MANETIKMNGIVKEVITGGTYKVELENKIIVTGVLSGKMKQHRIQILRGDSVTIELSPYDLTKGRITYRN